jgi:hypothetical protein
MTISPCFVKASCFTFSFLSNRFVLPSAFCQTVLFYLCFVKQFCSTLSFLLNRLVFPLFCQVVLFYLCFAKSFCFTFSFLFAMESIFDVCVIGAGLFGSACAKYSSEDGSTILIGPSEGSKFQVPRIIGFVW